MTLLKYFVCLSVVIGAERTTGQDAQPGRGFRESSSNPLAIASTHEAAISNCKDVRLLLASSDDGIAIQAAWHRAIHPLGRSQSTAELNRFLGFVEGRLGTNVPTWWCDAASSTEKRTNGLFVSVSDGVVRNKSSCGLLIPDSYIISEQPDGAVLVKSHETSHKVTREMIGNLQKNSLRFVSLTKGVDATFIVAWDYWPRTRSKLYRCAPRTGMIAWTADVVGGIPVNGGVGSHYQEVIVSPRGDVLVFGGASHCLFIEGFDAETGVARFRFATNYIR